MLHDRELGRKGHAGHDEGHDPDGDIHVEDPAPREVFREEAADQRPENRGRTKHRTEEAHIAPAIPRADDIADDRLGTHDEAAGSETLDGPERDERVHAGSKTAEHRTDEEQDDRGLKQSLAAVEIAELAPQRRRDRRREEIGGHHPLQVRCPAEVTHDGRQSGRYDRRIQRGKRHTKHQCDEDEHQSTLRQQRDRRLIHTH